MYCFNCGNGIGERDNFCSSCGKQVKKVSNSSSDQRRIDISGSNQFSQSSVHLGDIYQAAPSSETINISRSYVKPLRIFDNPVKVGWLIVSGIVGFLGSIASIFSSFGQSFSVVFILWTVVVAVLFSFGVVGFVLRQTRFFRFGRINLEANTLGEVFVTKIKGDCPRCDGTLRLIDLGPYGQGQTYLQCTRNSNHRWEFDFTILD